VLEVGILHVEPACITKCLKNGAGNFLTVGSMAEQLTGNQTLQGRALKFPEKGRSQLDRHRHFYTHVNGTFRDLA
jgi:hypothetical protein